MNEASTMTSWLNKKVYDEEQLINAIAFILNKCKNCQLYHDDQCVIKHNRKPYRNSAFRRLPR
ncbi:MAG: hypothetical protein FWJ59_06445 [Caldicoprobacter sp.]|uniref:hypothetical protein n=1 Tax=Caldicoprobacter sp. TaxID=2004500 RepID=UPI001D4B3F0F|nr:hypothetical protein [Clostridia bacterium]